MSQIVELKAENVKRLSAVSIKPDGSTVIIGGANGAGKSSVLDSIMYALGGSDTLPSVPLRKGAEKGQASVKLDDGLVVTRKFTKRKDSEEVTTSLEIKRANGDKVASPQALLDSLCGKMAFDPLEFSRLKPKQQLESLRSLVGIDFAELDAERSKIFERRAEWNRQMKAKQGELAGTPEAPDAPKAEISVGELTDELALREAVNRQNDKVREAAKQLREESLRAANKVGGTLAEISKLNQQIEQLKERLAGEEAAVKAASEKAGDSLDAAEKLVDADVGEVKEKIKASEGQNRAFRQNAKRAELQKLIEALETNSAECTETLGNIDAKKAETMKAAKFPVEGLGFDASGITFQGLPFDQASSAERLRVSVAMGLAANPTLRVLLIRDGSLLDADSLALVAALAAEAKAQVWIERVGEGAEVSVVIEDGHVKEQPEQSTPADQPKQEAEAKELFAT